MRSGRLQAEAGTGEAQRNDIVVRDERVAHTASLRARGRAHADLSHASRQGARARPIGVRERFSLGAKRIGDTRCDLSELHRRLHEVLRQRYPRSGAAGA